jgi:hypothetical protein
MFNINAPQPHDTIVIACTPHGVAGACVEYTHGELVELINSVPFDAVTCSKLHKTLKRELSKMLPRIAQGKMATDRYGELYDKAKFDMDLVHLAVYDYLGNGRQIALVQSH